MDFMYYLFCHSEPREESRFLSNDKTFFLPFGEDEILRKAQDDSIEESSTGYWLLATGYWLLATGY
jgi:hypothetical protein